MRGTATPRFVSSIGVVAALSMIAMGCGSDEATDDSTSETAAAPLVPGDDVETTTGMVDEPGNPEVSATSTDETDDSTVSTGSTETDDSTSDPDDSVDGHISDNLQDYIDSLATTTDNFDGLTTTPEETTCAATAVLTPIGVEVLQRENVSVEKVDLQLSVLEFATPESAVGIADGLAECGLVRRFAAAFAESETAEDLDAAGQLELRDCVREKLDDETAHTLLVGYLTPSTTDATWSPERTDAGFQMAGMVRDCGVDSRVYP